LTAADDGSGDGSAQEPARSTADFSGPRPASLDRERNLMDVGGRLTPSCKTSTAGSNPALASKFQIRFGGSELVAELVRRIEAEPVKTGRP